MGFFQFSQNLFGKLEERSILLIIVLLISVTAICIAYYVGGTTLALGVVLPVIATVLTVSKSVWTSDSGQTKVALGSLGIVILILGGAANPALLEWLLAPVYNRIPALKDIFPSVYVSPVLLVFVGVIIIVINFFMRDKTAMKKHETPLDKEFPEKDYKDKLESFCRVLQNDLIQIDKETNWSTELFVPLEAEVEVRISPEIVKKRTDLLTAIKRDKKAKVFLVMGEPGSGKSVALRKLSLELIQEVPQTGKVPIYINLREWNVSERWTETNPPTVEQLHSFILNNLKARGDVFSNDFLDVYFNRMLEDGRFFIILDSFDEIPAILDASENSWIVDKLSDVIYRFLNGAHNSSGILSSRPFRRPTVKFAAQTVLEIRPFSDRKISEALKKYPSVSEQTVTTLLTERRDLLQIAQNPFHAALIINYIRDNNGNLPRNRVQLYQSYMRERLSACQELLTKKGLTNLDINYTCRRIALLMFNSETHGLEYPIKQIKRRFSRKPINVDDALEVLRFAKIGRQSGNAGLSFSFAHRRFAEYFLVSALRRSKKELPLESIPNDSKWREVLILYAELASSTKASEIANYCWSEIQKSAVKDEQDVINYSYRAIHCLRFLRDAFRSRKNALASFHKDFSTYLWQQVIQADSLLKRKIALESVGLLKESEITAVVWEAVQQNNDWLSETAFRACFYLQRIEENLEKSLIIYLDGIPPWQFLKRLPEFLFILKLSPIFHNVVRFCYVRFIDCIAIFTALILFSVVKPIPMLLLLAILIFAPNQIWRQLTWHSVRGVVWERFSLFLMFSTTTGAIKIINNILKLTGKEIPDLGYQIPYWELIILMLVMPWYQIYYYLFRYNLKLQTKSFQVDKIDQNPNLHIIEGTNVRREKLKVLDQEELRKNIFAVSITIFALSILALIVGLLYENWQIYAGAAVGILLLLFYIVFIAINIRERLHDKRKNQDFFKKAEVTRPSISEHFYSLKTERGRLGFVKQLQDKGIKPKGEWVTALPNVSNDKASILLAQLEERWLNLDR